ncbi:hypothetical protein [Streptomyces agglomeratus]|uniref:hypothetical protein n=1 Tax=Streptomyces agglomeratus TaxID=285458 RepID=UPI0021087C30|nr:hypothetical protein [Streptomyces agglomeratus]
MNSPTTELAAPGPDHEYDLRTMSLILRHDHPRYEVTDQRTHLRVRRLSDAELHARADRAAARVAPYLAALTAETAPPVADKTEAAAEAAHALFDAVLRAAREKASDDPDDYDLMLQVQDMDTPDALAALKKAFLPSDMIEPIADALAVLAPHTYAPRPPEPARPPTPRTAPLGRTAVPARGAVRPPGPRPAWLAGLRCLASARPSSPPPAPRRAVTNPFPLFLGAASQGRSHALLFEP